MPRKESAHIQDLASVSAGGILRRPSTAVYDESPRKSRTPSELSSTSDTCITTGSGSAKKASCKKCNDVQTFSGDAEDSSAELMKLAKDAGSKKTRFANEVAVLHYEQESGDNYQTTEPLADETDQQERSYKRRDEKLIDIYPRVPDFSRYF
ncbi:hypothetical protein O3M35_007045 [Rhynocoris fuscipes]|uniref:Uncharacterized protein n=2 Tax=Rhynocoris fuscipes TaxID=488301 RepID=A0AAW1DNB1_9HEMI